jgi:hypothetical protein
MKIMKQKKNCHVNTWDRHRFLFYSHSINGGRGEKKNFTTKSFDTTKRPRAPVPQPHKQAHTDNESMAAQMGGGRERGEEGERREVFVLRLFCSRSPSLSSSDSVRIQLRGGERESLDTTKRPRAPGWGVMHSLPACVRACLCVF